MQLDQERLGALVERVVGDLSAGCGGAMVSIGDKLGLYAAMAGAGPLSAVEVADRAGCGERDLREWLNAQLAGGYVDDHPGTATYELSAEQAAVLADPESRCSSRRPGRCRRPCSSTRSGPSRPSAPGRASPGASTTPACTAAWRASPATPTAAASSASGSRRSTAWRSG